MLSNHGVLEALGYTKFFLAVVGSPHFASLVVGASKCLASMGNPTKKNSLILRILLRAIFGRKGIAI